MAPLHVAALAVAAPYALWLVLAYDWHFVDGANLLFHEAGHVLFGVLGETMGMLGGTIAQLLVPVLAALHFLRDGRRVEACLVGIWLGESGMNVARYLGDARDMALPLVGGGIHDWNWLLGRLGLVDHCTAIARLVHLASAAFVIAAWIAAWRAARHAVGAEMPRLDPFAPAERRFRLERTRPGPGAGRPAGGGS